jgi:pimeloyl-ACP methyl ester carboxylesterase
VHEKKVIKVGEVELEVHQSGAGTPLLLLHDELGFQPDIPIFAKLAERYRVIAPSHPGFGKSSLPKWIDRAEDFSYVYLDLIDHFKLDRFFLVGASLGAWVATEIAAKIPHQIEALVLIGPVGMKLGSRDRLDFPDLFAATPERLGQLYFSQPKHQTVDYSVLSEGELETIARNRETFALIAWEPYLHNPKLSRWAARIATPTLVIRGEEDAISSVNYVNAFTARFAKGRAVSVPQAGHLAHIDNPEAVARAFEQFVAA